MADYFGVGSSSLAALFLQVNAGAEKEVVEQLVDIHGFTRVYKAFGQFDIVALFDINLLDDERLYVSCEGVRASKCLTAYSITSPIYSSPDIAPWSSGSPILSFVFLEIDKWFYSPDSGANSSIEATRVVIEKILEETKKNDIAVAFYGGLGKAELYATVKTKNIDDVWLFTNLCRDLKSKTCFQEDLKQNENLPIFSRTLTVPCISLTEKDSNYEDFSVSGLEGKTSAQITFNSHPGFEHYILNHFPESDGYLVAGSLGRDDVTVYTKHPIDISSLFSKT